MALALLYVTLSNSCKWASTQFEIRVEPDLRDLPGHQVSAAKYATRSTQAVTSRCRRIGAIPCIVLPRDLRAFPVRRALAASSWAWGRKLSLRSKYTPSQRTGPVDGCTECEPAVTPGRLSVVTRCRLVKYISSDLEGSKVIPSSSPQLSACCRLS